MLLIPIGRDETLVRRQPVVTWLLMAVMAVVFVIFNLVLPMRQDPQIEGKLREVMERLSERPYLQVPAQLDPMLDRRVSNLLAERREIALRSSQVPVAPIVAAQQRRLDATAEELVTLIDATPFRRHAFVPARSGLADRITSMFLHVDLGHLLGNLLFLFVTAPFLEDVFGRPIFAALYALAGLAGTIGYQMQFPDSTIGLVGASGAIAGVMGAYLVRFARSKTEFLWMPIIFIPRLSVRFFMPAFVVFPLWFAVQAWLMISDAGESGVAFSAHVGGFVVGLVAAVTIRGMRIEERLVDPKIEAAISWKQDESFVAALDARREGDNGRARTLLTTALRAQPRSVDVLREALDLAIEERRQSDVGMLATRLLDIHIQQGEHDQAVDLIREITADPACPPRFALRAAGFLESEGEPAWALELYAAVAGRRGEDDSWLRATLRIARARVARGEPAAGVAMLNEAMSDPGCSDSWRVTLRGEIERQERRG